MRNKRDSPKSIFILRPKAQGILWKGRQNGRAEGWGGALEDGKECCEMGMSPEEWGGVL